MLVLEFGIILGKFELLATMNLLYRFDLLQVSLLVLLKIHHSILVHSLEIFVALLKSQMILQ
jgi:hypothetical protein